MTEYRRPKTEGPGGHWLPRSAWTTVPYSGQRRQIAICSASTTSSESMWSAIDQPTTLRAKSSRTAAQTFPARAGVLDDVGAPQQIRSSGDELPLRQVLVDRLSRPVPPLVAVADHTSAGDPQQPGDALAADPGLPESEFACTRGALFSRRRRTSSSRSLVDRPSLRSVSMSS